MRIQTYSVFGSGSSARAFRDSVPGRSPLEFLAAIRRLLAVATDDGDNGFVGHYSVPDEVARAEGVECWITHSPPCSDLNFPDGWRSMGQIREDAAPPVVRRILDRLHADRDVWARAYRCGFVDRIKAQLP